MDLTPAMELPAAYQGRGWRPRLARDRAVGAGVNSEFQRLKTVLLHLPGAELDAIRDHRAAQFLGPVRRGPLARELRAYAATLTRLGVEVRWIPRRRSGDTTPPPPNLMFARDLCFAAGPAFIVGRMASEVRAGEEAFAMRALAESGARYVFTVVPPGTFEGADALWLDPKTVMIGVGQRTNESGFRQVRGQLKLLGARAIRVQVPPGIQHLLGVVQIVDRNLAFVRTERTGRRIPNLLARHDVKVVAVPETAEVERRQALNIVTLAPRRIVMPDDCPLTERLFQANGVRVAARVRIPELRQAAGGLACATLILERSPRP